MPAQNPAWLQNAVFYEVYPQSFFDSNADGIGDLPGLTQKLPYIQSLGCNALWINPCFLSPFQDAGYDVADYYKIAPRYGTNADAKRLFDAAHRLGLRVCLDLVPAHTSIQHPWFKQSALPTRNKYTDWYIWTDSAWKGPEEKGMESVRGYSDRDGAYITNFFHSQPALNFGFAKPDPKKKWQLKTTHPAPRALRAEILKVMRFWLGMGADGFRVDMAMSMIKQDPGFKETTRFWQGASRDIKRDFPEAVLISEWGQPDRALEAGFDVDFMLHFPTQGYNSLFRHGKASYFHPTSKTSAKLFMDEYLGHARAAKGRGLIAVPSGNHDMDRLAFGRDQEQLRACFAFLACLPGVPFFYYGDEIGMDMLQGLPSKEGGYSRTGARTPMQWGPGPKRGFSAAAPENFYLPVDKRSSAPTVAAQEANPDSPLWQLRQLLALRQAMPALQADGSFQLLHNGSAGKPLAFLRRKGKQQVLAVIQPKRRPATLNLKFPGLLLEPWMTRALRYRFNGGRLQLRSTGTGFGIFEFYKG